MPVDLLAKTELFFCNCIVITHVSPLCKNSLTRIHLNSFSFFLYNAYKRLLKFYRSIDSSVPLIAL